MKFRASRDLMQRLRRVAGFVVLVELLIGSTKAQTNSWKNSENGEWQEETFWSLGILPDSSQSVAITNSGEKTVMINTATAQNFPQSLTVMGLRVSGTNTLLLNAIGTNVPLQVLSNLFLEGGTLVDFESGLAVAGLLAMSSGAQVFQSGGFVTNSGVLMFGNPSYSLTNGVFQSGGIEFINGNFFQHGGDALSGRISLYGGSYTLNGGNLVTTNITMRGSQGSVVFLQEGGTNRTYSLSVDDFGSNYSLNGGLLCTSNALIKAGFSQAGFDQKGGIHIVTNTLSIQGSAYHYPWNGTPAKHSISNGVLSARSIVIDGTYGLSLFTHINSTTSISESFRFLGPSGVLSEVHISGGTLTCSNVVNDGGAVDIFQDSGAFIVTNLFSFGGYYPGALYGQGQRFPKYDFSGGILIVSNIDLAAEWIIGSSAQTGRITNSGYFKMAGTLRVGDANEKLGRFILASNAVINLGDGDAKLNFAASGGEVWTNGATLSVSHWNGAINGGGADRLIFGADNGGLTSGQLSQIRFINPADFPPGTYEARILGTGEIVPAIPLPISATRQGTSLILNWPENWMLQTSTNVAGPYIDLSNAISPYAHNTKTNSQRFFRLRR